MSNLADHEAEQAAITAAHDAEHDNLNTLRAKADAIYLTPCERAMQIKDECEQSICGGTCTTYRAARVLMAIAPAYNGADTRTGMQDAMSDLMHLCDVAGWDIFQLMDSAIQNYRREVHDLGPATDDALRAAIERN